jgi:hypothetical protein
MLRGAMPSTIPSHCLAVLGASAFSLSAAACTDTARCDAALAGVDRARAEVAWARADAARAEAQVTWLRTQIATFANDLQARQAADRDLLLRRLAALEAANAALLRRLDRPQAGAVAPAPSADALPPLAPPSEPAPPAPGQPLAAPPSPPGTAPPRRAVRKLDESSPYE